MLTYESFRHKKRKGSQCQCHSQRAISQKLSQCQQGVQFVLYIFERSHLSWTTLGQNSGYKQPQVKHCGGTVTVWDRISESGVWDLINIYRNINAIINVIIWKV